MKIAFLNIYGGRVSRGAETAIHEIARRLSKSNDITVFQAVNVPHAPYTIRSFPYLPTIPTDVSHNIILRILKKVYLDPYSLLVLFFSILCIPALLKNKYDILIAINGFWQIIICKIIGKFCGIKIVVPGYAGIGIDDYINLKLSPNAFFAMTNVAAKWAKTINNHIPIKILPGGVDTTMFTPKVTKMRTLFKPPIVLTVAALQDYKRVDLVIKAVSQLQNVSLIVAGNGALKEDLENLGNKLLGSKFLRMDIKYNDLPSLYSACNIFTLPSKPQEAFGIVYLEAMASGLPIVAPNDELRHEIIGNAGIFVDCTDINQYSKALKKALSIEWKDIPQNQAKKFSWENIVDNFSKDLQSIIS